MLCWEKSIQKFNLKLIDSFDIMSVSSETKMNLEDAEGYRYFLSRTNLGVAGRRNGVLCRYFNFNPHTEYNIKHYLSTISDDDVIIVSFSASNAHDLIPLYCKSQDCYYSKSWNEISQGRYKNIRSDPLYRNPRIILTIDDVIQSWESRFSVKVIDSEYINNCTPIRFICNIHKNAGEQSSTWGNALSAKFLCCHCAAEQVNRKVRLSAKSRFEGIYSTFQSESIEVLGEYYDRKTKIQCRCKICNRIFYLRPDHIIRGIGCGCTTRSIGEQRISTILKARGIKYKEQYRFKDCIRIDRSLPYDFYLPNHHIAIEFDGLQHTMPVEYFGGEDGFKSTVERDAFKTQYCKDHNIRLIRIPYKDINNIESYLADIA